MSDVLHSVCAGAAETPPGGRIDIREMLLRGARAGGDGTLLSDADRSISGAQLLDSVPRVAAQLAELNNAGGRIVLIDAVLSVTAFEAYWATLHAGLVPLLVTASCGHEEIDVALSRLDVRCAVAANSQRAHWLSERGVKFGLVGEIEPEFTLPKKWRLLGSGTSSLGAQRSFADNDLCSIALVRNEDGTPCLYARSQRAVALTGLVGQVTLGVGDGEIAVTGHLSVTVFEWVLHCAVVARKPVTLVNGSDDTPETRGRIWQLGVSSERVPADSPTNRSHLPRTASRLAIIRDETFAVLPDTPARALFDVEVTSNDAMGFLALRQAGTSAAAWRSAVLVERISPPYPGGPKRVGDVLDGALRTPQAGVRVRDFRRLHDLDLGSGSAPADVGTMLGAAARQCPDSVAMIHNGQVTHFGEFADRAARLGSVLQQRYGIRRGDRVAFLALNRPEFFEVYLAAAQLGAIFTPLNFRLSAGELKSILEDCTPGVLIAEATILDRLGSRANWLSDSVELLALGTHKDAACDYQQQIAVAAPLTEIVRSFDDDPTSILYTTGTTGKPKGAVRSHKAVLWFGLTYCPLSLRENPDSAHLATPPLFHIAGHETAALPALALGRRLVIQNRFDADQMLQDIQQHRITSTFGPPTIAIEISKILRQRNYDVSSLRDWSSGSAPISIDARDGICQAAPQLRFRNSLGMTEAGGIAALQGAKMFEKPATCVGAVAAGVEVRIADAEGNSLPCLGTGEIQIRSPQLLSRYWNRPDETVAAFYSDWFHTGDLGMYDADGDLHIVGRLKEVIISGGENVYAAEVERALLAVPGIAAAAVIGVPDAKWGESVVAWITCVPGVRLSEVDVIENCRSRIAHYKCPRRCIFVDDLPRNAIGKVQKQELRVRWDQLTSL